MPSLFPQVKEYFEQLLSRDSKLTVENGIEVAKNLIEKAKRAQVGEIRTRSGQKFQKMGDGSWKPVKEGGKKPAKEEGNLKQSKKGEEQPKPSKGELKVYAKNTSEASLQGAIKGSADPEIRKLAHEELERRKKEEIPQEEGKVEGKKEELPISDEAFSIIDVLNTLGGDLRQDKVDRYIGLLKKEYGIDYNDFKSKDELHLKNISLSDIKRKEDFGNFDNYKLYAKEIYRKRGINDSYPKLKEGTRSNEEIREAVGKLGVEVSDFKYSGAGNYAQARGNKVEIPDNSDLGTIVHELGHVFDNKFYDNGISKLMTNASSSYGTFNSAETFAENFMGYFHIPEWLKENLPEVYKDLDSSIPKEWKDAINNLMGGEIKKGISEEKTPKEIADHHGVSFKKILEQLKMGVQVEYEHTDDTIEARRIALDHLMEIPDYYTRLTKMEAEAKGDIEKGKRDLSKYIKKRKLVTRGGKTFLQTVYESPEGIESPDKDKVEKELEKTYDFPELATGEYITIKGKKKSLTGELIGFYEYKGELYLTVKGSDGKSSEILVKSAKETPITKEEGKRTAEKAFPTEFDPSKVGTVLGGSSEVRLYDEKFVLKTARERDSGVRQLQYGQIADDVYRMMGIDTPKSKLFGDKKITEFVKGTECGNLNNLTKLRIDKELQKGFLLDCVLANWDVIGANGGNVILGDDGKVYRIDNDGVFDLRARGGYKDFDLEIQPTIDSMIKNNPLFKGISKEELARQAEELYKKRELIQSRIRVENINFKEISNRVVLRIEDAYKIFTAKEEPKPWDRERGEYGSSTTNEYFKDWDSFEFEGNGGIKDAIKKKITEVERDQESSYKGLASRLGMEVEELKYKLQKSLEETIQQCDFFTTQGFEEHDGSTVDKIFKSGRFKTQFDPELKKERATGGSFDPGHRSSVEKRYFGFTDDMRIHENRPVYGYWTGNTNGILNREGGIPPPNRVSQYGNVNFKVKGEKVLKSATFALEDSLGLDHRMACTPVAKPHFTSLVLSEYSTNIFERLELLKSGKLHEGANYYVEAQYHGGLSLKDIESVHISKDHLYKYTGAKEYSKEEVASSVSKLANLMIEHGAESGNMVKLKTF